MAAFNSSLIVTILRAIQAIFSLIVLGTTAYVAHWWSRYWHHSSPSQVNFLIFVSVWTLLALIFLLVAPMRLGHTMAGHKFVILAVESLTMLFWFAGFIALAVWLGDRVCFGHVCSAAKAGDVFAAFTWLCFVGTFVMSVMHVLSTRGNKTTGNNGKVHQPAMQEGV